MHTPFRRLLLPLVLLALAIGACQPTAAALPRLDDPKEILEESLRTTAELDFVHARLDVRASGPEMPADFGGSLEADIDMDRRDFHAVFDGAALLGGSGRVEVLLVGTEMFTRLEGIGGQPGTGRWSRSALGAADDPRAGIPPNPAIAVALKSVLDHPSLTAVLKGSEACGESQCYHVEATIGPDLLGQALNGQLFGPGGGEGDPVDPAIPPVVLDIRVEESTRRIVSIGTTTTYEAMTFQVAAVFTNHDVQVDLLPPPPDQVDDNAGGLFGREEILEQVGNEVLEGN